MSQELEVHTMPSFCCLGEAISMQAGMLRAAGLYVFAERGISVSEGIRASFNEDQWPESPEQQRYAVISLQSKML